MSVKYTHAHRLMEQAAEESRHEAIAHADASERPAAGELLGRVVAGIFFIPLAGPPLLLLLGPWLLLVLLIIPPAAALITLVLALVVVAGVVVAAATLIATTSRPRETRTYDVRRSRMNITAPSREQPS